MSAGTWWHQRALCRGLDINLFFPEGAGSAAALGQTRAKQWCRVCPVRRQCLEQAMQAEGSLGAGSRHGVHGGMDPDQRAQLAQARRQATA